MRQFWRKENNTLCSSWDPPKGARGGDPKEGPTYYYLRKMGVYMTGNVFLRFPLSPLVVVDDVGITKPISLAQSFGTLLSS